MNDHPPTTARRSAAASTPPEPRAERADLSALAEGGAANQTLLRIAAQALVEALDCRLAGIARLMPDGRRVETLALAGRRGARHNRRYRLSGTVCDRLYRSPPAGRYLRLKHCGDGYRLPGFMRSLAGSGYRGEVIVDSGGRPFAHVFAYDDGGEADSERRRQVFRLIAQRAGAELARQMAERAHAESELRFRNLIDGSVQAVIVHRGDRPLFVNRTFLRLFGFESAGEVLALPSLDLLVDPEDRSCLSQYVARRLDGGEGATELEFRARRRDGAPLWLSAIACGIEWNGEAAVQCTLTDITARKEAEAGQSQLAAIVDCSDIAIIGRRLDGTIFSWNPAAERLYGHTAEEAIGRPISIVVPEPTDCAVQDISDAILRGELVVEREMTRLHKNGHLVPIVTTLSPVRDAAGDIVGVSSITRDRSRRKEMERELEDNKDRLSRAQRFGRIGWWTWHRDAAGVALSGEACRVLGLEPGENLPPSLDAYVERFVEASERDEVARAMGALEPGNPVASCRHRTRLADGRLRVVHLWCEAVYDADGRTLSVNGIVQDMTELESYRQALETSEARFRDVTDISSDWVWETDAGGRFEYVSDRILSITGFPPQHYIGLSWPDCIDDWYSGEPNILIAESEAQKAFRDVRIKIATRSGRDAWVTVSGRPRVDSDGRFLGFRGAVADRTARVAAEAALREAKEEAESANLMKSRFLAAASHDLRQPLHAIRLLVSVLVSTRDNDKREAIVGEIATGLGSMSSILNALLDVSELDAGGVKPEIAEFTLRELCRSVSMTVAARAAEKELDFTVVQSSLVVKSDLALLARIVENFLLNAAKYTETGRILLGSRRAGDHVRIEVWDTGCGIPADRLEVVFEEFHQLETGDGDRENGLGLGLAIVRRLADLLDHRIVVRSMPGKGSMFAVEVPLAASASSEPAGPVQPAFDPGSSVDLAGRLILLIENGARVRDATQALLESWGARVVTATGEQHALQKLTYWRQPPDLIISDLQLPYGIDGVAAIQSVNRRFKTTVPSMILTGESSSETIRDLRRSGLPVLRKPATAEDIRRTLTELLQSRLAAE